MRLYIYILILLTLTVGQEDSRTALFYTTPGSENLLLDGHEVYYNGSNGNAVAEKFPPTTYPLTDDYMLEKIGFYYVMLSEEAHVRVSLLQNNNGTPGDVVEYWDIELMTGLGIGGQEVVEYVQLDLESECTILDAENWYWLSITANDEETSIRWVYSSSDIYNISISSDNGANWTDTFIDYAGAAKIYGEAIYYPPIAVSGDVTDDNILDILDIIQIINVITGNNQFTDLQFESADINQDGILNILDIVAIVYMVVNPPSQSPGWLLEDINPASSLYGYMIGPETFQNKISCYYFGKAG